ncbi:unnamed protein product [Pleuronectes platessa]|uniref:Liprin-beta-1/2 coiled-coil domain-containing protein n=1 Tax=Pleuronectes platessa TaxID=8262 RepID=A0A9N7Y6W0_PLEPL|nr:unnamed protein product [Pleuronectes platessa]
MASNASHMLEAALEQMDDIIAGKIGEELLDARMHSGDQDHPSVECTQQKTLPPPVDPALKTLQLTEALRAELDGKWSEEEQVSLRKHVSTDTANVILKWLERDQGLFLSARSKELEAGSSAHCSGNEIQSSCLKKPHKISLTERYFRQSERAGERDIHRPRMEYDIDFYKHFAWLRKVNLHSNSSSESYQERLLRLEGDKESLILQVSVLTDQVEAQGSKISDLEISLVEHRHKLNSTEEMLQQELLHRTSLENQKLSLMGEVSYLKLKLADMEGKQNHGV